MRLRVKDKVAVWPHGLAFLFCGDTTKLGLGIYCLIELPVGSASPVSFETGAGFGAGFGSEMADELKQVSGTRGKELC